MKVQFDCCKCIFNMITEMAKQSSADDEARWQILHRFLAEFEENHREFTPPEMAARFYSIFSSTTGIEDPFANEKKTIHPTGKTALPGIAADRTKL